MAAAKEASRSAGFLLPTGVRGEEAGMSPEQIAFARGFDWENLTPSQLEEVTKAAGLAQGGIAMRPITARIAERKPEAVIPLDRLEGMIGGGPMTVIVELDGRQIGKAVAPRIVSEIRVKTGVKI